MNLYSYVNNSPNNWIDPYGLLRIPFTNINIDFGEGFGSEALAYWASRAAAADNPFEGGLYNLLGAFSALWIPCTSTATVETILGGYAIGKTILKLWVSSLRGEAFELYLKQLYGGNGPFKKLDVQFDGNIGNKIWFEAKSGKFETLVKVQNQLGKQLARAKEFGKEFQLHTNNKNIPKEIVRWLEKKGIPTIFH